MEDTNVSATSEVLLEVLAALADENRFRIVALLSAGESEMSCGAIGSELDLSPSLISHHLGILEGVGIIDRRKDGLCTLNRLERDVLSHHLDTIQHLLHPGDRD